MAKTKLKSVDEYIALQPKTAQRTLELVRTTIRKALPRAVELISYTMPTYKVDGRPVLYLAGWKRHYSLYPASAQLIARCKDDLAPYEVEKGTIRFPLSEPVPVRLIGRIAKLRAREVADSEKAKAAAVKKRPARPVARRRQKQ
jgi:uncharacterized protein YdhG (YjbR/CyaY superfamily)